MKKNTITRHDLSISIYHELGISLAECNVIVDLFFSELTSGIKDDGIVKLPSFGSFELKNKNARIGRNPKTKEDVMISNRKVVKFYTSEKLKTLLNS